MYVLICDTHHKSGRPPSAGMAHVNDRVSVNYMWFRWWATICTAAGRSVYTCVFEFRLITLCMGVKSKT